MARRPHVALIVETSSIYGRRILDGINRFARSHCRWTVFLEQRELTSRPPAWLDAWQGDGVISRATTPQMAERFAEAGIPLVELTDRQPPSDLPSIRSDDLAIGRLGFQHLRDRGFRQFGFCGYSREHWSQQRKQGFLQSVGDFGALCEVYESPWYGTDVASWEEELGRLSQWLASLPRPVGVMACNDVRGKEVLDGCSQANLAVPEDVAVIGVDNDELLCELCDPPLSSVVPSPEAIGYQAAQWLDRWMAGVRPEPDRHMVPPLGIETRQSTDVLAIDDPDVAAALRMIRQSACDGLTVEDILREVPVSRSILERRFRKLLSRSPQAMIRQMQLKRVRELLAETDLSLARIAELAGYKHVEHMCVVFKREFGETPGRFRRRVRLT